MATCPRFDVRHDIRDGLTHELLYVRHDCVAGVNRAMAIEAARLQADYHTGEHRTNRHHYRGGLHSCEVAEPKHAFDLSVGDLVRCVGPRGLSLTMGKVYSVVRFEPQFYESDGNHAFTWPAYITITDDDGDWHTCHAHRFRLHDAG